MRSVSRALLSLIALCSISIACDPEPGGEDSSALGDSGGDIAEECPSATEAFGFEDENPLGLTGAELVAEANKQTTGVLMYEDGAETSFTLTVSAPAETVEVTYPTDEPEGCYAYSHMSLAAELSFATEDGRFNESFAVTLRADDGGYLSFSPAQALDAFALGGDFTPPAEFNEDDFVSVELTIDGWFGAGQTVGINEEDVLEDINGTIGGLGELKEWSCPTDPSSGCEGSLRNFYVGALRFD